MNKKTFFISGLPRSGSSLFSNIMSQNPELFLSGNSPICQIVSDTLDSCNIYAQEQLFANRRYNFDHEMVDKIIETYYKDVKQNIIFDKCRSWTVEDNFKIIKKYIDQDPKIIVFVRRVEDIVKSLINIEFVPKKISEDDLFITNSEPLMRSLAGVLYVKENNKDNVLIINYDDFIGSPEKTIREVYKFLGLDYFNHYYENIIDNNFEDDSIYGIEGMHKINSVVEKRNYSVIMSSRTLDICNYLNSILGI